MGLTVGIGFIVAAWGAAMAAFLFQEAQRLRRLFRRPYAAAFFYLLAVLASVFAVGGLFLGAAVIKAYWF